MKINLSGRTAVRVISFVSAAIVLLSAAAIIGYSTVSRYKDTIESAYTSAVDELMTRFEELRESLIEGIYTDVSGQSEITVSIITSAESALDALAQLPVSKDSTVNLTKYLDKVKEFSLSILNKIAREEEISEEDHERFEQLSEYADKALPVLSEIHSVYTTGKKSILEGLERKNNLELTKKPKDKISDIDKRFLRLDTVLDDFPDFEAKEAFFLLSENLVVSRAEAKVGAADFLNESLGSLKSMEDVEGGVPMYAFQSEDAYINVTKNGGYIHSMTRTKKSEWARLGHKEALERAEAFLKSKMLFDFKERSHTIYENTCHFEMVPEVDGVLIYPESIFIKVSLEDGEILYYNAENYLMNHKEREFEEDTVLIDQAKENVSKGFTVVDGKKVLIEKNGQEILCYEYLCSSEHGEYNIYINTHSGAQEEIKRMSEGVNE